VLGLLAGIPVASVNPPLPSASATVRLAAPASRATEHAQQAIASSYPVLARAARTMQPAMSAQALQSHVHITLLGDREMVINAQASNTSQATHAAAAVADSYIAYVSSRNAPRVTGKVHAAQPMRVGEIVMVHAPTVQYVSSVAPSPASANVLETSGLGALIGVTVGAVALIPRRRRLRMT
jgi:capsular polysaccharide biosynthesis protein